MLSFILVAVMFLLLRLRDNRSYLHVYESEQLLELGYHSACAAIKSAISEAVQQDNYWVIKQANGSCAIITPYQNGGEEGKWNYRYTGLSSHPAWIDKNRDNSHFFDELPEAQQSDLVALSTTTAAKKIREVQVQGLVMPITEHNQVRLSWWVEDAGAKISPRKQDDDLGRDLLASFEKIPGITDHQTLWEKVGTKFSLNEDQTSLWLSLVRQWQEGELGEDEIKYQIEHNHYPDAFVEFLDKYVSFARLPYVEDALVPVTQWTMDAGIAGEAKLNINAYVSQDRAAAIDAMSDYILRALPNWDERKGGFPESYTKTLMANILDYADSDDEISSQVGEYRGIEASPWINEWVTRYETKPVWNRVKADYDYQLVISQYAELWNINHHLVSGELQVSYEPGFEMVSATNERLGLSNSILLRDALITSHQLEFSQIRGKWLFPSQTISMNANEHQMIKLGEIIYHMDVIGPDFYQDENAVVLEELKDASQVASYRVWWNGDMIDRAGWSESPYQSVGLAQNSQLKIHTQGRTKNKIKTRLFQASFTYASGIQYRQSCGDPRMNYYSLAQQSAAAYPDNYSPYRRNVKLGLYNDDSVFKRKPSTRVLLSDWGDGGHSANYHPNHSFDQQSSSTATETISPDDIVFLENRQDANPDAAFSYIANRGYFVSETELARIFDPVMWSDTQAGWSGYLEVPVQNIDDESSASNFVGGGNTLRIGRAEHPLFVQLGVNANKLLELFHVGRGWHPTQNPNDLLSDTQKVQGAINLNTAGQEVIELVLSGIIETDGQLSEQLSQAHETNELLRPPTQKIEQNLSQLQTEKIAAAIVNYRDNNVIRSITEVLGIVDDNGVPLFNSLGNSHVLGQNIQANDAAQEELFARLYNQSTVRSKNFNAIIQVELLNKQGKVIATKKNRADIYISSDKKFKPDVLIINETPLPL